MEKKKQKKNRKVVGIWEDCSKVVFKNTKEASRYLNISRNSIYNYLNKDRRVNGKVLVMYLDTFLEEQETFDEEYIYHHREEDYPKFMLSRKIGEPILCKVLDKGKVYGRRTFILEFHKGVFIDVDLNIYKKVEPIPADTEREKEYNNKLNDLTLQKQEALNNLKKIEKDIVETNKNLEHLNKSGGYIE